MRKIVFILLLINSFNSIAQLDSALIEQLDFLVKKDQKWRGLLRQANNNEIQSISVTEASEMILKIDSSNYHLLQEVVNKHGFLDYDLVGKKGSHQFWLLMQHQDAHPEFQKKVLALMKLATEKNKASRIDYAYLIDRVKVNQGEPQIFGTQMKLNKDSSSFEPKPIIEPEKLNERRKEVYLQPIEKYIEVMNKRYYGNLK